MNTDIIQKAVESGLISFTSEPPKPARKTKPKPQPVYDPRYITTKEAAKILQFARASSASNFLLRLGYSPFHLKDRNYLHWKRSTVESAAMARHSRQRPGKEWVSFSEAIEITGFHRAYMFVAIRRYNLAREYAILPDGKGGSRKYCFLRRDEIQNLRKRKHKTKKQSK